MRVTEILPKLTRALHSISEAPVEAPLENLISQVAKEVVAAERLRALELRSRDAGKAAAERKTAPERHRRDARVPT